MSHVGLRMKKHFLLPFTYFPTLRKYDKNHEKMKNSNAF